MDSCQIFFRQNFLYIYTKQYSRCSRRNNIGYGFRIINPHHSKEPGKHKRQAVSYTHLDVYKRQVRLLAKNGVRYTVPQNLHPSQMEDTLTVRFRVGDIYKDCYIGIYLDDRQIARIRKNKLAPGEMEQVILKKKDVLAKPGLKTITIQVERGEANGTA